MYTIPFRRHTQKPVECLSYGLCKPLFLVLTLCNMINIYLSQQLTIFKPFLMVAEQSKYTIRNVKVCICLKTITIIKRSVIYWWSSLSWQTHSLFTYFTAYNLRISQKQSDNKSYLVFASISTLELCINFIILNVNLRSIISNFCYRFAENVTSNIKFASSIMKRW